MKTVNVAEFRAHIGDFLEEVEGGAEVQISKRNKRIARVLPIESEPIGNGTQLGCARGTLRILGDVVAPALADDDWDMHH